MLAVDFDENHEKKKKTNLMIKAIANPLR